MAVSSVAAARGRGARRLWGASARLRTPGGALAAVVVASAAWFVYQAVHVNAYIWLVDELLYVRNSMSYAGLEGLGPHVLGEPHGVPNVLAPLLWAPFYALLPTYAAFQAAHALDAIIWASTAIPVYLLGRRIGLSWRWALAAGTLAVWVPWSVATLVLMTETVAYTTFAWALLAITVAVATPSGRNDVLALLAIGLATFARTQQVFLLGVFVLAAIVFELSVRDRRGWRDRLRGHRVALGVIVGGALLLVAASAAGVNVLGGYEVTTGLQRFPPGLWDSAMQHAAHVVVGLGIVPAILFTVWAVRAGADPRNREERAFAIVGLIFLVVLFYVAAFFAKTVATVMQERYVIYAVPVIVLGAVALCADRRRAPRGSVLLASLLVAAVVAASDYALALGDGAFERIGNGASGFNRVLAMRVPDLFGFLPGRAATTTESLVLLTFVLGIVVIVAFNVRQRLAVPALLAAVLVFCALETRYVVPKAILAISQSTPPSVLGADKQSRDWVDDTVDGRSVTVLPGRLEVPNSGGQWFWHLFWNKSLDRMITADGTGIAYTGWPAARLRVDAETGRVSVPRTPELLLHSPTDPLIGIRGRVVRRAADGATILAPQRPLQARWASTGLAPDGGAVTRDQRAGLALFDGDGTPRSRRVQLTLEADAPGPAGADQQLVASFAGEGRPRTVRLAQAQRRTIVVDARAVPGTRRAEIRMLLPIITLPDGAKKAVRLTSVRPAT